MKIVIAARESVSRTTLTVSVQAWGYQPMPVENGQMAVDLLTQPDGPRLALLDWDVPGMSGVDVCAKLRTVANLPYRYLIVLTRRDHEGDVVTALDKGADDYVTQPWTPGELRARLGAGRRTLRLHERLEENTRALAAAAQTDHLTRIWNRSAMLKRLNEELSRAAREVTPLSVLMVDVDHFKSLNETYGRTIGDLVLVEVANRLSLGCRPYDIIGRYGGEEFLAVLPRLSCKDARMIGERFRNLMAAKPIEVDGVVLNVTISLGGTWLGPGDTGDSSVLLGTADAMLSKAKAAGRNRVEMHMFPKCGTDHKTSARKTKNKPASK